MNEPHSSLPFFGIPRLFPWLRPHGRIFLIMLITGLLGGVMDIILPLFQKHAINVYIAEGHIRGLGGFIALYLLALLFQVGHNTISAYKACEIEMYVGRDLKRAAFDHLQTLSFSYFNHNSVGYIHARVMSDTDRIAALVSWSLIDLIWSGIYVLGAVAAMLLIHWRLALWVLGAIPIMVLIAAWFQKRLIFTQRQVREQNSRITAAFNEGITGATTVKSLVIEEKMSGEFDRLTGEMRALSVRAMHFRSLFRSLTVLVASLALALLLWRGGRLTREGLVLLGQQMLAAH